MKASASKSSSMLSVLCSSSFKEVNVKTVEVFRSSGLRSNLGGTNWLYLGWFPARAVLA